MLDSDWHSNDCMQFEVTEHRHQHVNETNGPRITTGDSDVSAWVIPTDDELMIGRHTAAQLHAD